MNLNEIKQAIMDGKTVYWSNKAYHVILDSLDRYLIECTINGHCIGLTDIDGNMNEDESAFFTDY